MKIAIPKLFGKETLSIVGLSALLVLRTILSIYISDVNGSIVKAIVGVNLMNFIKQVTLISKFLFILLSFKIN